MSQNPLNAKALEAAFEEANSPATVSRTTKQTVEAAIRAYLASQEAAAPSEEPVAWQWRYSYREGEWGDWTNEKRFSPFLAEETRALVVASPAVAPVAVSVKAKDLRWRENPLGNFVAESIVGQYFVFKEDGVWNWVVVDISAWRNFPSPEAAKAAAQSDFNARILSSIIPATEESGE